MIHVAFIMNAFVPGGIKTLLLNYCKKLDRSRFTIDFIICQNKNSSDFDQARNVGASVIELPPLTRPLRYSVALYRFLRSQHYDAVITTMNSINVLPLLVSKLAGVKTRVSYSLSTSHPSEPTTLVKQLLRIFGKVGATEYAANSILAGEWLYGKGADFTIIPNTVDTEVFHYDQNLRETIRANLGLTSEIILGHIGRFEKQKNHEFLVSIFEEFHRRVEDSKLILVGWGSQRDRIFELIREKNLLDSVIYLGDTEDIVGLYNAFDCFILPSLYEGLPVVGIEAQACGCPCVFADTITRETSATESTIYISLKAPFSQWCEEILTLTQRTREDTTTQIVDSGFDLVSATHRFEHYLESLVIAS